VIEEYTHSGVASLQSASYVYGLYVDEVLQMKRDTNADGTLDATYYYLEPVPRSRPPQWPTHDPVCPGAKRQDTQDGSSDDPVFPKNACSPTTSTTCSR